MLLEPMMPAAVRASAVATTVGGEGESRIHWCCCCCAHDREQRASRRECERRNHAAALVFGVSRGAAWGVHFSCYRVSFALLYGTPDNEPNTTVTNPHDTCTCP
eukprot:scaffold18597_cov63-Phaeocystis_antarctica.AAC.4